MKKLFKNQILQVILILVSLCLAIAAINTIVELKAKENQYVSQIMLLEIENTTLFEENIKIKDYYFMLTDCCNENQLKEYNNEENY
jgi:hypothetical protein